MFSKKNRNKMKKKKGVPYHYPYTASTTHFPE